MNKKSIKLLAISLALLISSSAPVFADTNVKRISGNDRYETAMKVDKTYFNKANGNLAIIAPGYNFRIALYGSYMANALNVPFYVIPNTGLSRSMMNELSRLKIKRAYVMGDYKTLNRSIDNSLKSMNIKVQRFYDKYENDGYLYKIDEFVDTAIFQTFHGDAPRGDYSNSVIINDRSFPDLLAAIPLVSKLTREDSTYLGSYQDFDTNSGFRFIIGGYNTVPAYITTFEGDKPGLNIHVWDYENPEPKYYSYSGRIAGVDRYATAVEIANSYKPLLYKDIRTAVIVNGKNYPDALASGTVATHTNGAVLLTEPNRLNNYTRQYIQANNIKNIIIVGGENSVSKNVENELRSLN